MTMMTIFCKCNVSAYKTSSLMT